MCLAQGPQRSDAGEARTRGPSVSSQALYHWATALPINLLTVSETNITLNTNEKTTCWFGLILYVPVNNFAVMLGQIFLGWTSTKQWIKCLAQGHSTKIPPAVRIEPATLLSQNLMCYPPSHSTLTLDRWQSKMLILSSNVNKKSLETVFWLPFVASTATNGNRKYCF